MKNIMQKKSVAGSGSSSTALSMGLVCCCQLDKKSSQFCFLRIGNRDGISINHQLSFSTHDHVRFVSSCNGLLLLISGKKKRFIYHVFNPLTRENFSLPQACVTGTVLRSGLAVDEHQNYQVVLLHGSAGLELDVFSSETGKWKRQKPINLFLPLPVKDMFPKLTAPPLFSNGAIHWEILGHLLIYNVHNYHCKLIELPCVNDKCSWKSKMNFRGSLWESEGRVHYSYTDTDGVHA
ncbi:putative F-box family protein [Melia azedarach]|nr:putative F-box family protein [Melia azedarach]